MTSTRFIRNAVLLGVVLVLLFLLQFALSEYHVLAATRMMVLAIFAVGFNVLLGNVGLLSLGHALFFGCGLYAAGLSAYHLGWSVPVAFLFALAASALLSLIIGAITLRTIRVSFMIVTLMFAQVGYLTSLYLAEITGGHEGLSLPAGARSFALGGLVIQLSNAVTRYNVAFLLVAVVLVGLLLWTKGPKGRLFTAIRENEGRTEMLGFDVFVGKLEVFVVSGTIAGTAGAAYALLFGYVGSTFASFQYSIEALLFTLLGGAGTLLGPLVGVVLMVTMIDKLSEVSSAYLLAIGAALIVLILWFPKGILGTVRERWAPWLA